MYSFVLYPSSGDEVGVAVMLFAEFHVELFVRKEKGENYLMLQKRAEDMIQLAYKEKIGTGSTRFLCCELAGKCFTGTVWGIYTACQQKTGTEVSIREWSMH